MNDTPILSEWLTRHWSARLKSNAWVDKIKVESILAAYIHEFVRPLQSENATLRKALQEAKECIHTWHGVEAWEIYEKHSPEMKFINAALNPPTPYTENGKNKNNG